MAKSLKQVLDQIEKLQQQADALRAREVSGVVGRIQEAIRHYGLTSEDLFGTTTSYQKPARGSAKVASKKVAKKSGAVPKYSSGDGRTWSGVGKRPDWFKQAIESGKTAEDLLIDNAARGVAKAPTPKRAAKKAASRPSAPKYRGAEGQTWTGVGKRPKWFVDALEAGKTAENLLIQ